MKLTFECDDLTASLTFEHDPDDSFDSCGCGILFGNMIRIIGAHHVADAGWLVAAIINYLDELVYSPANRDIEASSSALQSAAWDLEIAWTKHRTSPDREETETP